MDLKPHIILWLYSVEDRDPYSCEIEVLQRLTSWTIRKIMQQMNRCAESEKEQVTIFKQSNRLMDEAANSNPLK